MAAVPDKEKALELALAQIDKQYGKGSIMRLGERPVMQMSVIPTGSIALDIALGVGGLPRGRIVEIYGPEASGKCLTADTYLWTDRGLETVAELFARCGEPLDGPSRVTDISGLGVRLVNERGELEPVAALTHNGRQPVTRVTLRSGRTVTATGNHPLRVLTGPGAIGWRPVGEIRPGDVVVSARFGAVEAAAGDGLSEDEATLLGHLVAGGSLADPHETRLVVTGPETGAACGRLLTQLFGVEVHAGGDGRLVVPGAAFREHLVTAYGLDPAAVGTTVPQRVRTAGHKAQRAFLAALFAHHGWAGAGPAAGLVTGSGRLAREVQLLLYGLGVPATVAPAGDADPAGHGWRVTVDPTAAGRLRDEVGAGWATPADGPAPTGPTYAYEGPTRTHEGPTYTYEEVVAVEVAGERPTFDVVLPRTHSFLANGVLSHNTTVALHAVANAQRAGGIAAFIDAEHALDPEYAKAIGVDTDSLLVSQPDTGEQALEIADMLIRSGALDIIVIDSVAALVPRAEIEGEMGDSHVGLQARLMSQALRKITGALNNSGTTAIFINQLREKVGVLFGSPETTSGGRALKFYASVRLDVRRIESLKDGGDVVGNRTRVKVVKNKVSAPFKQAEMDILYGKGISREGSLIDVGVEQGIVRKSGAWYTYDGDQLGQGKENARTFLKENPDVASEIEKKILEKLNVGQPADAAAGQSLPPVDF
jgi:recombination protein RecA